MSMMADTALSLACFLGETVKGKLPSLTGIKRRLLTHGRKLPFSLHCTVSFL